MWQQIPYARESVQNTRTWIAYENSVLAVYQHRENNMLTSTFTDMHKQAYKQT